MRQALIIVFSLIAAASASAQTPDPAEQAEIVKQTVGAIAGSKNRNTEVVLRDLREFKGKIIGVYPDEFVIRPKGKRDLKWTVISVGTKPRGDPAVHIRYRDVLQVEGKNAVASFVPDPKASPYSSWSQVEAVGRGEFVQVLLNDGRKKQGVFYRAGHDSLSLMEGNREVIIAADKITKVYRVKGDTRSLLSKVVTGGTRGAEIAEDWFPLLDPRALAHPLVAVIGAAIGTTIYLLPIGKTSRLLVYSK